MLLRRVIQHLKGHHWTGVALDFVIVVLGVFIGLQASNWNTDRQNDVRAHQVLADLQDEFQVIDEAAKSLGSFYESSLNNQVVLLDSLRAKKVRPEDREAVKNAVALGLVYGDPPPPSGTFRDLLSSGNLALVRDKELRIKLIEYDQSLGNIATSDTNIQVGLSTFYRPFSRHMTANAGFKLPKFKDDQFFVDTDFTSVTADFDGMLADPDFRAAAEQVFLAQQYRLINIKLSQSKAAKIRELIEKDRKAGA